MSDDTLETAPSRRVLPQVERAPSPPPFPLLVGYFALLAACLLAGSVGLLLVAPSLARGDFLSPHVLAVTHLFTLGIVLTAILGVMHQFYPMALGHAARSLTVAVTGLCLLGAGIAIVTMGFWLWHPVALAVGWLLLFGAVGCVSWNLLPARRHAAQARFVGGFVSLGHVALGLAMLLAAGRIGEFLGWWSIDRLGTIAAHFHLAALGFGTLTAVGVGSRMLPMFLVSRDPPRRGVIAVGVLLAAGLVTFAFGTPFHLRIATWVGASLMFAGVLGYLAISRRYFRRRLRRRLDPAMRAAALAFVNLGLTAGIGVFLLVLPGFRPGLWIAYGVVGVLGWLVLLILGILQKLVPHLGGMRLFGRRGRSAPVPDPNRLLHGGAALSALVLAEAGVLLLAAGAAFHGAAAARIGATCWLAGAAIILGQFVRIPLMARGWVPMPAPTPSGEHA